MTMTWGVPVDAEMAAFEATRWPVRVYREDAMPALRRQDAGAKDPFFIKCEPCGPDPHRDLHEGAWSVRPVRNIFRELVKIQSNWAIGFWRNVASSLLIRTTRRHRPGRLVLCARRGDQPFAATSLLRHGIETTDGRAQSRVNRKAVVPQEWQLFPDSLVSAALA